MSKEILKRTPLYNSHLKLGARMVPFAGYEMPVQYSGILEETRGTRSHAGLFDVSHMGQFRILGDNSLAEVNKLVTNDLTRLQIGQAQYNMMCNEKGGVIDDLVVYRYKEKGIFICVNASNRKEDFAWMKAHLPSSVTLRDESDETALLAIQGPLAEAIMKKAGDPALVQNLKYYWAADTKIFGLRCFLSRTGYTGEDGFEIYLKEQDAGHVWERLLELGSREGLIPVGLGARDTLRLEMGYPLHGHELSKNISPIEANLNWVVKTGKKLPFIGQAALKKQIRNAPRTLKAFLLEDRRIARQGYRITKEDGKAVGSITSGTMSPHLNKPIALGFIESSATNDKLFMEIRETLVPTQIVKLPFVAPKTKRPAK